MVAELIEFSSVIADIYDAAIEPRLWQQALSGICSYVGGISAVLFWHDAATERSEVLHLFNDLPEYTKLYFEKYLSMNPMFPAATFVEEGAVVTSAHIMPRSEFVGTRFYKEWVRPQGMEDAISVTLEKGAARAAFINIRTSTVPDIDMCARTALLVPHLQRAVAIGRLFDQSKRTEQALTMTLDHVEAAVLLVGSGGKISFTNEPARKLLNDGTLLRASDNMLRAILPESNEMLEEIFAAATTGDAALGIRGVAVALTNSSQDPWFAHVLPLTSGRREEAGKSNDAVAAVLIRKSAPNAPPPLEVIAKRYNLVPSEVRVLAALAAIQGVKELANSLGLSQGTVKTHLHNLFRKTGTKRQSELVALIAGI